MKKMPLEIVSVHNISSAYTSNLIVEANRLLYSRLSSSNTSVVEENRADAFMIKWEAGLFSDASVDGEDKSEGTAYSRGLGLLGRFVVCVRGAA